MVDARSTRLLDVDEAEDGGEVGPTSAAVMLGVAMGSAESGLCRVR